MPAGLSRAPRRSRFTTLLLAIAATVMVLPAAMAPQTVHAATTTPTVTSLSPEAGPTTGGTTVTINGSNFDSSATVSFGSNAGVAVTVLSSTALTVITPVGVAEGQVQVTVTTIGGGTSSPGTPATMTTFQFTNPGPFVPLNADICDNQADGNTTPCAAHGPLSNVANQNSMNVQVTGEYNIPASGVAAVAVELFTAPTGPGASTSYGNVGVFPTGLAGGASDLSWVNGDNGTLLIEIPVSPQVQVAGQWTGGQITVSNSTSSSASINFILDVEGYVADTQTGVSGLINALPSSTTICSTGDSSSPCYIAGGAGLASGHWLQFPVLGLGGVPSSGVSAVTLNLQTYAENGVGWGVAYPDGQPMPAGVASALWNAGTPMTTHIIVPVDSTGKIAFYNGGPGATQVSVAVDGWFTDNSIPSATGGLYNPNNGTLVCDTIAPNSTPCSGGGQLTANSPMAVQIAGLGGVPSNDPGLTGVELSLTVTNVNLSQYPPGTGTYVCLYPSGSSCQEAELNLYGGVPGNLLVIVPLGPDGKVDVYTPTGSMDVLIAVTGYYMDSRAFMSDVTLSGPTVTLVPGAGGEPSNCTAQIHAEFNGIKENGVSEGTWNPWYSQTVCTGAMLSVSAAANLNQNGVQKANVPPVVCNECFPNEPMRADGAPLPCTGCSGTWILNGIYNYDFPYVPGSTLEFGPGVSCTETGLAEARCTESGATVIP